MSRAKIREDLMKEGLAVPIVDPSTGLIEYLSVPYSLDYDEPKEELEGFEEFNMELELLDGRRVLAISADFEFSQ